MIRIGSLNVQNSKINRNGGILPDGKDNAKILADHIEKEKYYFFCTQELTKGFSQNLLKHLKKSKLYGDYRYGDSKLIQKFSVLNSFNENNAIITSEKVAKTTTNLLPWIPINIKEIFKSLKNVSIMPRIVTTVKIKNIDIGTIYVVNTHLDYQIKSVQIRQLNKLYQILKSLSKKYPVVLTGDFNMELGREFHFNNFVEKIEKLGLKRVPINENTFVGKNNAKKTLDHIFIPKTWIIEKTGLIEDENLNSITDHNGVYVDIKIK